MPSKQLHIVVVLALTMAMIALSACSSDDGDEDTIVDGGQVATEGETRRDGTPVPPTLLEQPDPAQSRGGSAVTPVDGIVDVATSGSSFVRNTVQIPLGEPVLIRVTNSDQIVHNLRIAGLDGQFETQDDAVTDPDTIAAGGVGELTFAPPVAGEYTFRCDFHPATMGGVIVVE